jgi:hypothetical protein
MDDLGAGAEPVVVDGRVRGDGDDLSAGLDDAAGLEATFSISAEIRARPVVTLLKVKAEISTKCAARRRWR